MFIFDVVEDCVFVEYPFPSNVKGVWSVNAAAACSLRLSGPHQELRDRLFDRLSTSGFRGTTLIIGTRLGGDIQSQKEGKCT